MNSSSLVALSDNLKLKNSVSNLDANASVMIPKKNEDDLKLRLVDQKPK